MSWLIFIGSIVVGGGREFVVGFIWRLGINVIFVLESYGSGKVI